MIFITPAGLTFDQWKEAHEQNGYKVLPPCGNVWRVRAPNGIIVSCLIGGAERTWITHGKTLEEQDKHDIEMEKKQ